MTHRFAR